MNTVLDICPRCAFRAPHHYEHCPRRPGAREKAVHRPGCLGCEPPYTCTACAKAGSHSFPADYSVIDPVDTAHFERIVNGWKFYHRPPTRKVRRRWTDDLTDADGRLILAVIKDIILD
jgi:hypothetical protein